MQNDSFSFSKSVGLSIDDTEEAFQALKRKGYFFTNAKTAAEVASHKYPIRIIGNPPNDPDKPSIVSFGPFAVSRKIYEQARDTLEEADPDAFKVLLGYYRLMYEKTGTQNVAYRFSTKADLPESEYAFLATTALWDLENPIVFDEFVWFVPTKAVREMIEESNHVKFAKNDYSWWNYKYDLGTDIQLTTMSNYPELYHLIPTGFIDSWGTYLPKEAFGAMMYLYRIMLDGQESKQIGSLQEMVRLVKEGMDQFLGRESEQKADSSAIDKELLLKELYDYNSLTYPIDATTTLDFLQQIGLVEVIRERNRSVYQIPALTPKPKKALRFPKGWHKRMDGYVEKGTILFSYLTTKEIVG